MRHWKYMKQIWVLFKLRSLWLLHWLQPGHGKKLSLLHILTMYIWHGLPTYNLSGEKLSVMYIFQLGPKLRLVASQLAYEKVGASVRPVQIPVCWCWSRIPHYKAFQDISMRLVHGPLPSLAYCMGWSFPCLLQILPYISGVESGMNMDIPNPTFDEL